MNKFDELDGNLEGQNLRDLRRGYVALETIDEPVSENAGNPARRPSCVLHRHILSNFLPFEVVRNVECNGGWYDVPFGNEEDVGRIDQANYWEIARLRSALRHIRDRNWSADCRYVMQNLSGYKTLLGRLLEELKDCRKGRAPRSPALDLPIRNQNDSPEVDPRDLINALEALLLEFHRIESINGTLALMLLDEFDQHIFSVHHLIDFLS